MSGHDIERARLRGSNRCGEGPAREACDPPAETIAHAEIEIEKSRVLDLCRVALPSETFHRLRLLLFRYEDALRELLREKDNGS